MKIKDLVSASNNSSALHLVIFDSNKVPVYIGVAEFLGNEKQEWEIDTIISRGGQTYKEVYVK